MDGSSTLNFSEIGDIEPLLKASCAAHAAMGRLDGLISASPVASVWAWQEILHVYNRLNPHSAQSTSDEIMRAMAGLGTSRDSYMANRNERMDCFTIARALSLTESETQNVWGESDDRIRMDSADHASHVTTAIDEVVGAADTAPPGLPALLRVLRAVCARRSEKSHHPAACFATAIVMRDHGMTDNTLPSLALFGQSPIVRQTGGSRRCIETETLTSWLWAIKRGCDEGIQRLGALEKTAVSRIVKAREARASPALLTTIEVTTAQPYMTGALLARLTRISIQAANARLRKLAEIGLMEEISKRSRFRVWKSRSPAADARAEGLTSSQGLLDQMPDMTDVDRELSEIFAKLERFDRYDRG